MYGLDTEQDAWVFAYAAHLYYHGHEDDPEVQSPLTDDGYEVLKRMIITRWSEVPAELQTIFESPEAIKHTGMHIKLTEDQLDKARRWLK